MSESKNVLVVLSGCGFLDGAEIHESVISLLSLARAGATTTCTAPDKAQMHVIDHAQGAEADESRNVRTESARIARGDVLPLSEVNVADYDAIFLPGGFGAAKNLCTLAVDGPECTIDPNVEKVIRGFHAAGKPIGAVCIAPALVVRALGLGTVTIGNDAGTAGAIAAMGGTHADRPVTDIAIDGENKIVTAPAYMYSTSIDQVAIGIEKAVGAVMEMTQ